MYGSNVFVLFGRMWQDWPQPLADLLVNGRLTIEAAASVHEVAALLVQQPIRGLLVDPATLAKRDVETLGLVAKRVGIKMLLLPVGDVPMEQERASQAVGCGAMCWEDAARMLSSLMEPKPDNHNYVNESAFTAKTVTPQPSTRYDEPESECLVSDEELQVLLGN